jgi:RND family efflux transporter MFP subunit
LRRSTGIAISAVVVIVAGGLVGWREWPAAVMVAQPTLGPAIEAVYATGVVEPTVMLPVAPRSGGRLTALNADEGALVRRGQVLARIESADLEHTVQEMAARERLARIQYERTKELVAEQFLSAAELDRTLTELDAAQASLKRAQAQNDYNMLVAPADGTVLRRDGEIGQFIPAGQTVFTLSCCAPLRVAAEVDEEDIARVAVGQKVTMRSDALPKALFEGEVAEITPKGDPVARSYRVRVRFNDESGLATSGLRTGMTMDANLIVSRREAALLVPNAALHADKVWVVDRGKLRELPVSVGVAGTERSEILSGLADGDSLVVSPADGLREGRRARVTAAATAASVPSSPR